MIARPRDPFETADDFQQLSLVVSIQNGFEASPRPGGVPLRAFAAFQKLADRFGCGADLSDSTLFRRMSSHVRIAVPV